MSPLKIFVWFETESTCVVGKFSQDLVHFGVLKCTFDHYVFYQQYDNGIVLLFVYVDVVITRNDASGISSLKTFLQGQFHTKDLGHLKYFLVLK